MISDNTDTQSIYDRDPCLENQRNTNSHHGSRTNNILQRSYAGCRRTMAVVDAEMTTTTKMMMKTAQRTGVVNLKMTGRGGHRFQ